MFLMVSVALTIAFELGRRTLRRLSAKSGNKWIPKLPKLFSAGVLLGAWLTLCEVLSMVFGTGAAHRLHVDLAPERMMLWGLSISNTVITTWIAMAVVIVGAILVRVLVLPKCKIVPSGAQNVVESIIVGIDNYASSKAHGLGENLSAYLFTVAVLMIACACVELLGVRAPTSDITMTFALALISFILINYYGIKRKGLSGRMKALNSQGPIVMVLRVISDIAIPVSMACRLFGNMLGGMIVMELVYGALGRMAVGIPSVLGLYFNAFHPLIQAFIFITLTLTFIDEAIE